MLMSSIKILDRWHMLTLKSKQKLNNKIMNLTGLTGAMRSLSMSPGVSVTILMPSKDIQVDALFTIPNFCVSAGHYDNAGGVQEKPAKVVFVSQAAW